MATTIRASWGGLSSWKSGVITAHIDSVVAYAQPRPCLYLLFSLARYDAAMDMAFQRRGSGSFSQRHVARLDYRILLASVRALQQAAQGVPQADLPSPDSPLTELLVGAPGWRRAIAAQGGCFNRRQAEFAANTRSTEMTDKFTFAF